MIGWIIFIVVVVLGIYAAIRILDWRYKEAAEELLYRVRDCDSTVEEQIQLLRDRRLKVSNNPEFARLIDNTINRATHLLHVISSVKDRFGFTAKITVVCVQRDIDYIEQEMRIITQLLLAISRAIQETRSLK